MASHSPETIAIDLAGADRVDDVRELWLALHRHEREVAPVQLLADDELSWQRRRSLYLERLSSEAGFMVLATAGEAVAGYAFVWIEDGPDDTFSLGDRYAELYSLSVAAELRRRGIGTRLLDFVDRELAARSIHDIRVAVMIGNAGAQRLYERRGLQPAEVVLYRLGPPDRKF